MLGSRWLGWHVDSGATEDQPELPGLSAQRIAQITASPRRYGWHATLKAPFALAPGRNLDELKQAIAAFVHVRSSIELPPLYVSTLSGFIALAPQTDAHGVSTFAMEVVRAFDRFRAPLDAAEIAKRRKSGLSARQEALMLHWGYPYVMEEYKLHLTLTESVDQSEHDVLIPFLEAWFAPSLMRPELITDIALLEEPSPGAQFRLVQRFTFGR
jgi:hypothetical protein